MLFRRVLAAQLKRPKSSSVSANAVQHFEDIPSPKGFPIIGTTFSIIAQGSTANLHNIVDKRHKKLGPIYKERLGPVSAVFVSDPEEIRAVFSQEGKYPMHLLPDAWVAYNQLYGCSRGLFFMEGPRWWHHRRIMNRHMLKGDFTWIEDSCDCVSDKLIERLHSVAINGAYFENLESALYKWSMDVMVSVLLGADTYSKCSERLEEDVAKLAQTVHLVFQTSAKLALIPATFASKFNIPYWKRFVKSVDDALEGTNHLVNRLIKELNPESNGLLPKLLNDEINQEDIKPIIVDLLLAAGDTTSCAMEWILYEIGKHKEIQEELRHNPKFIYSVFKETLRLYPIAPFLTRILPEDSIVCGYGVPKNTIVVLSVFTSGRDERYFKNPSSFEPKRWNREDNKDYHVGMQKATLPFAIGLRACIGRKIAETQIHRTLLKIINNFDLEVGNTKKVNITLKMLAVPSEPIKLRFRKL